MQSPNRGGVRPHTYGVVLHSTRGGASSYDAEYRATLRVLLEAKGGLTYGLHL